MKGLVELLPLVYDELRKLAAARMAAETGEALGLSRAMAYRNWKYARAWLREALKK